MNKIFLSSFAVIVVLSSMVALIQATGNTNSGKAPVKPFITAPPY